MARVDLNDITRTEIQTLVSVARNTGQNEAAYVKTWLTGRYPGIENMTIRVNGVVYPALDYLVQDTGSYGTIAV